MFNRPHGERVWGVMYELARIAGLAVMPVGCGTCVADETLLVRLPEDIPQPVVVVRSGAELIEAVRSVSRR